MSPTILGVLNYTPNSFFDGGKNFAVAQALETAANLLASGADYIDVGAEATNPFVKPISAHEEIARLEAILPKLFRKFPNQISLDTYHTETLAYALQFGKPILNDVSGLLAPGMAQLAVENELVCIVGHLPTEAKGVPTASHSFKMDDFELVVKQSVNRVNVLLAQGMKAENIILDPNIGFGKTMRLNWQLVKEFATTAAYPVLIGVSHKRFLGYDEVTGEVLKDSAELRASKERNLQAARYAVESGASFLRVHEPEFYTDLR